ncbi:MAG: hypothetical protein Q8927_17765 [Bacteroidota bacterium]|nr:hypothetical protein [Bacteroidota bacterium]MDP4218054.1 hypothetical protein [Bacteroidota bacterium]MDP4254188.1 hypothetical protein [Bacteroidota bacterium]
MRNEYLSAIGRIFFGLAIAAMGLLTIYYKDFPYMLIPPKHIWLNDHILSVYISGALLALAGGCILFRKQTMPVSLLLGTVLLLVFLFYFIPYELFASSNYMHFGAWENAAKELALSAGAFVMAGCFSAKSESPFIRSLGKLSFLGPILFSLTIISFSIDHFLYAEQAAGYVPSWISNPVFWIYFAGVPLLGSGLGILLKIKPRLMATLLGIMILIWVIILHIPKSVAAPFAENGGEIISAFLALAYCGIAFVIAGCRTERTQGA